MIEFLTIFLGLTFGPQEVEFLVKDPRVARIELRLDGAALAELRSAPWKAKVDLGPQLSPRLLSAQAFDTSGQALERVAQILNRAHEDAEARLEIERDKAGRPTTGSLVAAHAKGRGVKKFELSIDGGGFRKVDPKQFDLSALDPGRVHFLVAQIDFADGQAAVAEAVIGNGLNGNVSSSLTAIPVEKPSAAPLVLADLQGAFKVGDRKLEVMAIDEGGADVIFVPEKGTENLMRRLREDASAGQAQNPLAGQSIGRGGNDLQDIKLGLEDRLAQFWPKIKDFDHPHVKTSQVEATPWFRHSDGGVFHLLTGIRFERPIAKQRLGDAVGVAGMLAAKAHRKRAVVLVVGSKQIRDASELQAQVVIDYLAKLGVPFLVWTAGDEVDKSWGEGQPISSMVLLRQEVERLQDRLARQAIVWVTGRYFVHQVEVEAGKSVRIVGRPAG
jgi:hypothetical protein